MKQSFRNWEIWVQIFIFPAFFLFAIAFLYGEESGYDVGGEHGDLFNVGVINNDDFGSWKDIVHKFTPYVQNADIKGDPLNQGFGKNFIENINGTNYLLSESDSRYMVIYPLNSIEEAVTAVQNRFVSLCFIVPENFSRTLLTGINHKINVTEGILISNSSDLIRSETSIDLIGDYSYSRFSEAASLFEEQLHNFIRIFSEIDLPGKFLTTTEHLTSVRFTEFHTFVPAFYIMTLLLSSAGIAGILGKEKDVGTIDRLQLSNFSQTDLILSLSLTQFITTGLQLVAFFAAIYILGFPGQGSPFFVSVIVSLSVLPILGLGLMFAVVLKGDAALYGPGLLSIPLSFLTGSFIPLPKIAVLGEIQIWHINPFYSTSEAIRKILFLDYNLTQVSLEIFFLIILGLGIFILGALIFWYKVYESE